MTELPKVPVSAEEFKEYNRTVVAEFRANAGKVGGHLAASDVLLLHTTGAKTGLPRLTPLAYFVVGGTTTIVGSYAGAPADPAWVTNLRAQPLVRFEVGTATCEALAGELPQDRRDAAFAQIVAAEPRFGGYQAKTSRLIPLFELQPRNGA
jgi:deazaflavin-dependent oxidoreductase (nitroreductase family)